MTIDLEDILRDRPAVRRSQPRSEVEMTIPPYIHDALPALGAITIYALLLIATGSVLIKRQPTTFFTNDEWPDRVFRIAMYVTAILSAIGIAWHSVEIYHLMGQA